MIWDETLYPSLQRPLPDVAERLRAEIERRGVLGPPLAFGDHPGIASVDGSVVAFGGSSLRRLSSGTVQLFGSPEAVTARCEVGLPGWGPVLLGVVAAIGVGSLYRGVLFDSGVALAVVWMIGGFYVCLRLGLRHRILDLLNDAVSGDPTLPASPTEPP